MKESNQILINKIKDNLNFIGKTDELLPNNKENIKKENINLKNELKKIKENERKVKIK